MSEILITSETHILPGYRLDNETNDLYLRIIYVGPPDERCEDCAISDLGCVSPFIFSCGSYSQVIQLRRKR